MAYQTKWSGKGPSGGPSADKWFEALRKEGWKGKLPSDDKPELDDDHADHWRAINELGTERQGGFGLGAIPFRAIVAWLDEEGIERIEERMFWRQVILAVDRELLSQQQGAEHAKRNRDSVVRRQSKGRYRR